MRLYLDDDCAGRLLVQRLRKAGHDVLLPADAGLAGAADPVHLRHAVHEQRVSLSRNYRDFKNLHDLVVEAQGHHPGILVIRKDNDPRHDLKAAGVVRAIGNLLTAAIPLGDQYIILNHWR